MNDTHYWVAHPNSSQGAETSSGAATRHQDNASPAVLNAGDTDHKATTDTVHADRRSADARDIPMSPAPMPSSQGGTVGLPTIQSTTAQKTTAQGHLGQNHQPNGSELGWQDNEIQTLRAQLRQTHKEQAEFSYAISHDLKSPTNTMLMLIAELRIDHAALMTEDGRELLDLLDQTSNRMRQIVDDMLIYSRCNEKHETHLPVDLNVALRDALDKLELNTDLSQATISVPKLPVIFGNRMQLKTMFLSLIGNSIKFRHPDRRPEVILTLDKTFANSVTFSVSDNGIGIDPQFKDRIFGLFQRLHGYDVYKGSGVGLALCKRIVTNHSGDIQVSSVPGNGSTFTITLKGLI